MTPGTGTASSTATTPVGWILETATGLPAHDRWLSAHEQVVLAGLRFPKRRADWRLGRWTAKRLVLSWWSGVPEKQRRAAAGADGLAHVDGPHARLPTLDRMANLHIHAADDGAPEVLTAGVPQPIVLSISHSGGFGFAVVGEPPLALGCDLERIEPRDPGFLQDYFTRAEQAWIRAGPPTFQALRSTLAWSTKESVLKALHEGLRMDTRSVVVQPVHGEGLRWSRLAAVVRDSGHVFRGWWRARDGFVLTVLADRPTALHLQSR